MHPIFNDYLRFLRDTSGNELSDSYSSMNLTTDCLSSRIRMLIWQLV